MRRNSPDSIASLANRAQKQFPKDRQRPGILTTAALQPLVERIQQKDRDLQAKAEKSDEYATKLSFFENAPATREELLTSLSDDEIRGNFCLVFSRCWPPVDVIAAFKTEVVLDSVTTGDLAAVLARRLVADWERPIQVPAQGKAGGIAATEKKNEGPNAAKDKKAEEAKAAEEKKKAEEAKAAEEKKKAEEAKAAEEKKKAEEAKAAEDKRKAEEAKAAEEKKKAEEEEKPRVIHSGEFRDKNFAVPSYKYVSRQAAIHQNRIGFRSSHYLILRRSTRSVS